MESFNNSLNTTTTLAKPTAAVLTYYDYDGDERRLPERILLLISYLIIVFFPLFAICGYMIVWFLRSRGQISHQEAGAMMKDISSSIPLQSPMPPMFPIFPNSYNGRTAGKQ